MTPFLYYLILIGEASFLIFLSFYLGSLIYSSLMGAPYVPTKKKRLTEIFKEAKLKKGQKFVDLGSGDGRVVFAAAEKGLQAVGVDVNLIITLKARLIAKLHGNKARFKVMNLFKFDLSTFDAIYIFLMPDMATKLGQKILDQGKNEVLVIAHGFKIVPLSKYLVKTLESPSFPTYFYKVRRS